MTANEIIRAAFDDLGILQVNESLSAADATGALRRLNNLCSTLRTQSLAPVALERQVFRLTAGQQAYSIGVGAEFNVARPQTVSAAALLLNGLTAEGTVSSISRSGNTATVTTATDHGLTVGEPVLIFGADDPAYNQEHTVLTTPTATTFTYQVFNSPTTPATGTITWQTYDGDPVEVTGRTLLTQAAYASVQLKGMSNSQFTNVWYNPTQPYGTIWLWPIPDTTDNQLVLYQPTQFLGFASLTQDYTFPDTPGWAECLEYNLAKRLIGPYSVSDPTVVQNALDLARTSLANVKRQNYPTMLVDLPSDAQGLMVNRRGGYNINTNSGG